MLIKKTDPLTGKENTYEIDVTPAQLKRWLDGELIQRAMPQLQDWEREFLINGMSKESSDEYFAQFEEDEG